MAAKRRGSNIKLNVALAAAAGLGNIGVSRGAAAA